MSQVTNSALANAFLNCDITEINDFISGIQVATNNPYLHEADIEKFGYPRPSTPKHKQHPLLSPEIGYNIIDNS